MALLDGSGQVDGTSSAAATAALYLAPSGTADGSSVTSNPEAFLLFGGSGVASGVAGGSGDANLDGVLAGVVQGQATVSGETHPFASGTASGSGSLADAPGVLLHGGTGTVDGLATVTGAAGLIIPSTGIAEGSGELLFASTIDVSGVISGKATVLGSGLKYINVKGLIFGTSGMVFSAPLPIYGKSTMVGEPVVDRVPLPVNAIVAPPKCFRYMANFQRGDLPIFICDRAGPVSPVRVYYTLFQRRPNGTVFQVGPSRRTPAQGVVGEYYATGRAGESGQPGQWMIRWEFQRNFQSVTQIKEMDFQVLDAVLANNPRDVTPRVKKYGWN